MNGAVPLRPKCTFAVWYFPQYCETPQLAVLSCDNVTVGSWAIHRRRKFCHLGNIKRSCSARVKSVSGCRNMRYLARRQGNTAVGGTYPMVNHTTAKVDVSGTVGWVGARASLHPSKSCLIVQPGIDVRS